MSYKAAFSCDAASVQAEGEPAVLETNKCVGLLELSVHVCCTAHCIAFAKRHARAEITCHATAAAPAICLG